MRDIHAGSASSSEKVRFSETHSSLSFFRLVTTSGTLPHPPHVRCAG